MKKILLTFVLLVGIVAGLFAQKLTYQAVIRDNNQQLVVNTAVKATVTITFTSGDPYQAEFNGSTNLHGLLSVEFGDATLVGRDWTGATIAVKVVNSATSSIVYVNDEPRPVSAVPYALSVNGVAIQQYLTEHKYVTEMQVGNQIHDSISNVAKSHTHSNKALLDTYTQTEANLADAVGKKHTHDNMAILNATTAPYTDADSTKLDGIEAGAQKNVQSDWKQTDGSKDDYIKNKPSITDTVNGILSTGGYVTADALDSRHYLTSDSTVITTMQGNISTNKTNIQTNAGTISALTTKEQSDSLLLAGRIDALENASMDCNDVKECIKDTLSKYTVTDQLCNVVNNCDLSANASLNTLLNAINAKMDSLAHLVDSLAKLPHGGGEVADGQPCPGAPTVSDGTNTYNTVKIGNQCWMKENLRTKTSAYGNVWTNPDVDSTIYGRYYDWAAVMQNESGDTVRGICPEGWHVPSDAEWTQLTTYVNSVKDYKCNYGDNNIANALSAATGWQSPSECCAGYSSETLNKTGFSAVPAGYYTGNYLEFGSAAAFWSATQNGSGTAYYRYLTNSGASVNWSYISKGLGSSVRCLRDAGTGGGGTTPVPVEVSCEQVMECMGDTLGKLNTKIENLKNTVDSLAALIPEVMSVTTDSASTVTKNNATLHGNVTGMGEYSEVNAGFKYGTSESTLTSIVVKDDAMTATGLFSCDLVGLTANTKYYFKAFAANGTDTVYGEVKNFTTKDLAVATNDATEVKSTAATLNGELTVLKGYPNANAGFKYGTSESTLTSIVAKDAAMADTSQFSCDLTGLTANTQYYFKAFAANGTDTVYGEVKNFTTKDLAVATNDATEVKSTAATLNGKLTELKGYENANAGFKYGTSESTLTSIVVKDDAMTATGLFSCDLVGLTANTKYYFKAFAANGTDTVYGEVKNFTTRLAVATNDASNVTKTTATLNGMLTLLEGYDNAKVWFKYGTSESTLTSIVAKDTAMTATGLFSCDIDGLTVNTKYYFKAFAANGTDTVYGEVKNFRTLSNNPCPNTPTVTDIDNNEYNTVQIGDQCWMAENLRTTKYADSTSIPLGSNSSGNDPYRYNPGNSSDNVSIYGYLYNWKAVMGNSTSSNANPSGVQGVCPTGWHVPSDAEWTQLTDYVSSQSGYVCGNDNTKIAKALADTTGWSSNTSEGCNAGNTGDKANATGFAAVPAGYWLNSSTADSRYAYFWSATQDLNYALCRYLRYYDSVVLRISDRRDTGFSVRCLKD